MTTNAPNDDDELEATAENPPTPESSPRQNAPDNPTLINQLGNNGNANKTGSQTDPKDESPDANPGADGPDNQLLDGNIMPDDSDTDDNGRIGLLSTRTKIHAVVIGITAGAHWGLTGDMQLINDVVGVGILGDRARQANKLPQKYIDQAKEELPYFIGGCIIGYIGARADALAGIEIGMGIGV